MIKIYYHVYYIDNNLISFALTLILALVNKYILYIEVYRNIVHKI